MLKIILFEVKKIMRSNYFYILLAIFALLLVGYYTFVYHHTVRVEELIVDYENRVHIQEEHIENIRDEIESSENVEKYQLQRNLEIAEDFLSTDSVILSAYKEHDWQIGRASCRGKSVDIGGRRSIRQKKK